MVMSDTNTLRDHASCIELALKSMAADVSTDFGRFSWISMKCHVIILENIPKSTIFRIFTQNYQHSRTRRVEKCIMAHVSMDLHRFASIRINFRVGSIFNECKYSKIDRKSTETQSVMTHGHTQVDRNVARASPSPNKVEHQVIRITMIRWSNTNTSGIQ